MGKQSHLSTLLITYLTGTCKMKNIILCLLVLISTGCSTINTKEGFVQAGTADMASTALALTRDGLAEGNPLGVGGVIVAKAGVYMLVENIDNPCEKEYIYHTANAFQYGAAVNNLLLFAGAASGVSLLSGIVTGFLLNNYTDKPCLTNAE